MEVVVASGKGGTGKTFVASNLLYYLSKIRSRECVGVDADVEAPDLALALGGYTKIDYEVKSYAARRPVIDTSKCIHCGLCAKVCRSAAISLVDNVPRVDLEECEGCGVCAAACPVGAIDMVNYCIGKIVAGTVKYGMRIISGELDVGMSNSGRLVYELKSLARKLYRNSELFVVDAVAGIGCPVISSIVGADLLIIVMEPTPQSIQGALRLKHVAETLHVRYVTLVNKYDLNPEVLNSLSRDLNIIGEIPFDNVVFESYANMTPVLLYKSNSEVSRKLMKNFNILYEGFMG